MKLLVTGGAGFIGTNFIKYWLTEHFDDEIVNFDKLTYAGNLENLKDLENNPHYKFIKGDVADPDDVRVAMTGVDIITHFAAESHVDRSILAPATFIKTNVLGTQVLLDAAVEHKIKRFHHISTDEVFGSLELNDHEKFDENTPYDPRSPYSASKAAADHLVRAYYHTFKLPVTISNCSNNFGPYEHPEKLIPLAITNLLEGVKIPIYGDGKYVRDWLYVIDHCRAIDLILQTGKIGKTYLIGGLTKDISNIEVVKMICEIMNKNFDQSVEFVKDRPGHDRRYSVDWSKINKELKWKPDHDFKTWLQKTVEWYKNNKTWWKRVKSGEYQEYYQKQYGQK
ncbi:dTDP-glucose 4,6-dehydratase [Candidatus Collierbacteria bacterium]|nr:dTDP-glucose 4,6-dehydratase [Candidatus Collierbacteria bacterium]